MSDIDKLTEELNNIELRKEQLLKEIDNAKEREKNKLKHMPPLLARKNIDLSVLTEMATNIMKYHVENSEWDEEPYEPVEYLEAIVEAIYGPNVWGWWNNI